MRLEKMYLILHSYELIALLWIAIFVFSLPKIWTAAAIGMTQHLLLDSFTNPLTSLAYFMTFRIYKGFRLKSIIKRKRHYGRA